MLVSMKFSEAQEKAKVEHFYGGKKEGKGALKEIQNLKEINYVAKSYNPFHNISVLFQSACHKFKFLTPFTMKCFYFYNLHSFMNI